MKHLRLMGLLLGFGVVLAFLPGCDRDDDKVITGPTQKAVGDTLDPVFAAIDAGVEFIGGVSFWNIGQLLEATHLILYEWPESTAVKGPSGIERLQSAADTVFYVFYDSTSQYWHFYISFVDTTYSGDMVEDISEVTAEDSIQFLHGAIPVQWPDSAELTGIIAGGSLSWYSLLQADTVLLNQDFTAHGDIPAAGVVVLAGTSQITTAGDFVSDSLGSCHGSFTMVQTISNVEINLTDAVEEDGCPTAGTIHYDGTAEMECDDPISFSSSDSWSITQTVSGNIITTVLENSTTVWTVSHTCPGEPSAVPRGRFGDHDASLDRR
jgi:hypothetical protein